jgi:hypothetical protein
MSASPHVDSSQTSPDVREASLEVTLADLLFDHFVGEGEQRWWDVDAKRPSGLEIYN